MPLALDGPRGRGHADCSRGQRGGGVQRGALRGRERGQPDLQRERFYGVHRHRQPGNGGVLNVSEDGTVEMNGLAIFRNNSVQATTPETPCSGGSIYNKGIVRLRGGATFADNFVHGYYYKEEEEEEEEGGRGDGRRRWCPLERWQDTVRCGSEPGGQRGRGRRERRRSVERGLRQVRPRGDLHSQRGRGQWRGRRRVQPGGARPVRGNFDLFPERSFRRFRLRELRRGQGGRGAGDVHYRQRLAGG
ncbi:unnamed protein product [Ectocarpus sp. 6 AP-2014]